jgi:hypothetical protein
MSIVPKVDKKTARYQTHPRGIARCERCSMFRSPHSCTKVAGDISPRGWSKYFDWKDDRTHMLARREQLTRLSL